MNPVQVIGDRDTVLAFALGGVPGRVARTPEEARRAVDAISGEGRPLLLLVTRGVADLVREDVERLALDPAAPLLLELPGFGEPAGRDPVARLVARVLGLGA